MIVPLSTFDAVWSAWQQRDRIAIRCRRIIGTDNVDEFARMDGLRMQNWLTEVS